MGFKQCLPGNVLFHYFFVRLTFKFYTTLQVFEISFPTNIFYHWHEPQFYILLYFYEIYRIVVQPFKGLFHLFQKRQHFFFRFWPVNTVRSQSIHGLEPFDCICCLRSVIAVYCIILCLFVRVVIESRQSRLNLFTAVPLVKACLFKNAWRQRVR